MTALIGDRPLVAIEGAAGVGKNTCSTRTTAGAVLTVAEACRLQVPLLGDRHQLAAVGRGGDLDLAVGQVDADAYLTLQGVHRFPRIGPDGRALPDVDFAA